MGATQNIVRFVCEGRLEQISAEVLQYAKSLCLSSMGMSVGGSVFPIGKVMQQYVTELGGKPECTVVGTRIRTNPEDAAMVNGTFGHATEYEDDSWPEAMYTIHLIPALFALGEKLRAPGRAVLEAFILGYQVQSQIGKETVVAASARGWLNATHLGTIGVAAACAKLVRLSPEQTRDAITLAASSSSGLFRQIGTSGHLYEAGISARAGIGSARLAALGCGGDPTILEGRRGLLDALAGMPDLDFEFDGHWRVMEVGIKKYPCCYLSQRATDGVFDLIQQHHLTYADVQEIEVGIQPAFPDVMLHPEPRNGEQARFSLPHILSAVFLDGSVVPGTFTDGKVNDPRFKEARKKVKLTVHPEFGPGLMAGSNPVTIRTRDGRVLERDCLRAKGDPPDLLTPDAVMRKFLDNTDGILSNDRAERAGQRLLALEKEADVSRILADLVP